MDAPGSQKRAVLPEEDAAIAFGAILEALSNVISPALIDRAGWVRLGDAVRGLPVDPGAGFGFELRLAEPTAGTDFYAVLQPGSALADHYIRCGRLAAPGSVAAALGERLATIDTGAPWADILGVEHDVTSGSPSVPPGLFARLRSDWAQTGAGKNLAAETVATWLAGAVGWRLTGAEREALCRAFDGLEASNSLVADVGIMPGRPARAFKITSRPMEPARALSVLDRLQWRGPADEAAAFLSAYSGLFRFLRLAFSVAAGGVLPRIGFELFQGEPGSVCDPGVGEWAPFLTRLCADGLCLPEKMEGLLAWPGREIVFFGQNSVGLLTGLAHIKVSLESTQHGRRLEAKAYPAAGYLPFQAIDSRFPSR